MKQKHPVQKYCLPQGFLRWVWYDLGRKTDFAHFGFSFSAPIRTGLIHGIGNNLLNDAFLCGGIVARQEKEEAFWRRLRLVEEEKEKEAEEMFASRWKNLERL